MASGGSLVLQNVVLKENRAETHEVRWIKHSQGDSMFGLGWCVNV